MEYADLLEKQSADSGYCSRCGYHLDDGCECSEEERNTEYPGCTCPLGQEDCTC